MPPAWRGFVVSAAFMDGGFFLIMAAMPFKVLALGGDALDLGLVPAIGSLCYIVAAPIAGWLSDRASRTRLCFGGAVALVVCAWLAFQVRTIGALLALQVLMGIGKALYWPSVQSTLGDLAPAGGEHAVQGRFNVGWSSGKTAAFLAGGLLLHAAGFKTTFLAGAGCIVLAFVALPKGGAIAPPTTNLSPPDVAPVAHLARLRALRRIGWIANTAAYGALGILTYHLPQWFATHGWGEVRYGAFLGGVLVWQTVVFVLLLGPLRITHQPRKLWGPQVLAAAAVAGLPLLRPYGWLLVTTPLLGLCGGICYAASLHFSLALPQARGRNAGIHEGLIGAGGFLPPLLAGLAVKATGDLALPYVLGGLLLLAAVAAQIAVWQRLPGDDLRVRRA